jgi:hypothetical protein
MADPWVFGWTQLFTIIGFAITITIAAAGFRTFERWRREKIEEKRIDTAIDALALVYESKFIFDHIRSVMTFPYEWNDMPQSNSTDEQWSARRPFYAVLKRIEANKDFFERAWKVQVRCTALFGPGVEEIFLLMQRARREIEVSAGMLFQDPEPHHKTKDNLDTWNRFRADVWPAHASQAKGGDQVGQKLSEFKIKMEELCRPIIDREYGKVPGKGVFRRVADWLGVMRDPKQSASAQTKPTPSQPASASRKPAGIVLSAKRKTPDPKP